MLYIGCPMWGYKEWIGNFFPAGTLQSDFLRVYSKKLTAVEGNTTFYATPAPTMIARWRNETPGYFRFCPKISRTISHSSHLAESAAATRFYTERMRGLGERLGPMFLQLPSGFSPAHLPQLECFLDFWPKDLRLAVEVRHPNFFTAPHSLTFNRLLEQYNVARVIMDTRPISIGPEQETQLLQARERKPILPVEPVLTTDFIFLRYIGHPQMDINEPLLDIWAQQLGQWLRQGITAWVFCHCPFEVHSPDLCKALYQRVRSLVPLPPLPEQPGQPEQATLF